MPEKSVAVVRPHHMLAMMSFISTEPTRFYIGGVHIAPYPEGGAVLVATNGHMLLCIHDPSAFVTGPTQIWRFREIASVVKSLMKSTLKERKLVSDLKDWLVYEVPELGIAQNATVCFAEAEKAESLSKKLTRSHCIPCVGGAAIDGAYPEWARVFPHIDVPRQAASSFQPAYLKQIGEAALILGCDTMTFTAGPEGKKNAADGPAIFSLGEFKDDPDSKAIGLIMAMRTNVTLENYPYWLQAARGFGDTNVVPMKEAA